jgi:hypothetical protein
MDFQARKYNQAAIGYLAYGLIYLAGAVHLGRIGKGPSDGSMGWYLIGAAIAFGFPYLIWKRFKWFTRALAVLVLVRVIGLVRIAAQAESDSVPLPWGGEIVTWQGAVAFMLVAALTSILLARAGWQQVQMNEKSGGNATMTKAAQAE